MKKIVLVVAFCSIFGFLLVACGACTCKKEQTNPATAVAGEGSSQDAMTTSAEEVATEEVVQ
ncbi:MAG: hypothetical protein LE168_01125 [Endomicrobium sp.]|nr:hypothetical protein [Endomicrobium sp.]